MAQTLTDSLREAWVAKWQRAEYDLRCAQAAPALFKPEWTERATRERDDALRALSAVTR